MFRRNPPAPAKNGHKNGNGHANGQLNGNGHNGHANGTNGNGNGHSNGNGTGPLRQAPPAQPKTTVGIETVIGANASYNGLLNANAGVRIDGCFDGTIEINGPLIIGEGARVVSESIRASAVSVAGSVKGNIMADKVEILRSGRIYGDINVVSFITEEGAILRGNVTMRDPAEAADETRPVPVAGANGHQAA
jgi:cytoskeletal protein CcmA (bactofilin family)